MQYLEIIKQEIEKILVKNFPELKNEDGSFKKVNFQVGFPESLSHGDVTTNVCLVVSKLVGKSPKEIFDIIVHPDSKYLGEQRFIKKIEFANPGFINIWLKQEVIEKELEDKIGIEEIKFVSKQYFDKKVLVEHTSINLFKPFTIGHLMNNFTGEFIYRITKELGAQVVNISYPSDISLGVAKAIYIIKNDGELEQNIFGQSQSQVVKYLGESYVRGVAKYKSFEEEKNEKEIAEIKKIANNLFGNVESEDLEIFEKAKKINLDYFKSFVENLNSKFDNFIFESESAKIGLQIVLENTGENKVFKKSEGAIIYEPKVGRKDINTAVFINSEGNPTYLGKDIGLLHLKFTKYNPDFNFIITDNEQTPHFKTFIAAGGEINKNWEDKTVHVPHGRMTFQGKKMSSRLGGVPSGEEVINVVLEEVKEKSENQESKNRFEGMSPEEIENLQNEIALSALRVAILRSKPGVNIDFDPERSLSFEGDSGPYLCYTHARCCSLLEKRPHPGPLLLKEREQVLPQNDLLRKLFQFEKIVVDTATEIAPQKLIKYLFEVAGEFNNFYAHNKIITNDQTETAQKIRLVYFTKKVLEKGLYLIGVKAPERM